MLRPLSAQLVLVFGLVPLLEAQSQIPVDLVVRDNRGALVSDLREAEVELYEDGVKQTVEAFRHMSPHAVAAAAGDSGRLVVFLFPRLPAVERDLAKSAAEEFVKKRLGPGVSVAVLNVGSQLVPVQGFTADPEELKLAVKRALAPAAQAGDPELRSLYTAVQWLKDQPGRKTALLFSSGLAVPPGFEEAARELTALANQHRVSFYGIDPRGIQLATGIKQADYGTTPIDLGESGAEGGRHHHLLRDRSSRTGEELRGHGVDFGGYSFRGASPQALSQLAQGTGGFVVEPSNSFGKAMQRVAEDVGSYYELHYTPKLAKAEGQYRKLEVKVARKGAKTQVLQEYRVGSMATSLVPAFERRLHDALDGNLAASDVEVFGRALHFGWDGKGLSHVLWLAVPLEKVSLVGDPATGKFEGNLSILARIKDSSGKLVESFSQRTPLAGPIDQVNRAREMSVPFVRKLKLAPGSYTLETAVQDGRSDLAAVRRTPLTVSEPKGIALSSLSLGDLLPAAAGGDPDDPLRVGDKRLMPNLGQPIKAGRPSMTLYCAVYPQRGSPEPTTVHITLLLGGQPANAATATLPAPDASGRIPYSTAFRMDVLPAGDYRFDVKVAQGASQAAESLSFSIVP